MGGHETQRAAGVRAPTVADRALDSPSAAAPRRRRRRWRGVACVGASIGQLTDLRGPRNVRGPPYARTMSAIQQELPLPQWGGARKGAGRKRKSTRKNVPHRPRKKFRRGALHVTCRLRREVWELRTHRCFRALKQSFARGCERFGFRLVHFSVQGNHVHWTFC